MIRTGLVASAVLIALAILASLYGYVVLPSGEPVAVHWSASGEVNRYASKTEALIAIPLIMLAIAALMAVLPRIEPRKANLMRSSGLYTIGWIGGLVIALAAHVFTIYAALTGESVSVAPIMVVAALLFAVTGNYMAKSRSNWFLGLRTPWSLSSEAAWTASNRAAGWGFVATGVAALVALVASVEASTYVLLAGAIGSALLGTWISFDVWRRSEKD